MRRCAISWPRNGRAFPDDILWRRTKLGLTMPPDDREALAAFMASGVKVERSGAMESPSSRLSEA